MNRPMWNVLLLSTLLACGSESARKPGDRAASSSSASQQPPDDGRDWAIQWAVDVEDRPLLGPFILGIYKDLNSSERPTGSVSRFSRRGANDRFLVVANNAPSGEERLVRFFVFARGADNAAAPTYDAGAPSEDFSHTGTGDMDNDGLPDVSYCRYNRGDSVGVHFAVGFRNESWYRIDPLRPLPPCTRGGDG